MRTLRLCPPARRERELVDLLAKAIGHIVFLADEPQERTLALKPGHSHTVAQAVTVQPSTGRQHDRVLVALGQLVRQPGAAVLVQ